MRKRVFRILIPALLAVLASCEREKLALEPALSSGRPIAFGVVTPADVTVDGRPGYQPFDGGGVAATRASVVSSLSSFRVSAVTGSSGSESAVFTNQTFTGSAGTYTGTAVWPVSDPSYKFFASNASLTYTSSGATVSASNSTDVICAYMPNPTYGEKNTLVFNHIFSRIGNVTVAAESGFTVSGVSVTITPYVSGTYNLETGAWTGKSTGSATSLANSSPGTKSNDLWLVPGSYTVTCSWSAAPSGGGSATAYTNEVSESFTLIAGKTSAMTITMGSNVVVEVVDLTHSDAISWNPPMGRFGDWYIAPGNLYYDGTDFLIASDWNEESYNEVYGKNAGSYYFNFTELGKYFDARGNSFTTSSGAINDFGNKVSYGGYDDWYMGDYATWNIILTTSSATRPGSTVNGNANKHFVTTYITGVSHSDKADPCGLLIFPDGMSISGQALTDFDNTAPVVSNYLTEAQLNAYLEQGCVFLPPSGQGLSGGGFTYGGYMTHYWTASIYNSSNGYVVDIGEDPYDPGYAVVRFTGLDKSTFYSPVRLIRRAAGGADPEGNWIRISSYCQIEEVFAGVWLEGNFCQLGSSYDTSDLVNNPPVVYSYNWSIIPGTWTSRSSFKDNTTLSSPTYIFNSETNPTYCTQSYGGVIN